MRYVGGCGHVRVPRRSMSPQSKIVRRSTHTPKGCAINNVCSYILISTLECLNKCENVLRTALSSCSSTSSNFYLSRFQSPRSIISEAYTLLGKLATCRLTTGFTSSFYDQLCVGDTASRQPSLSGAGTITGQAESITPTSVLYLCSALIKRVR